MTESTSNRPDLPRPAWFALILGLYLSLHGYRSLDGDQAYRLPLLLHRQDPSLYADDPFVRAFETFNPHVGYLALLDVSSRVLGLSAALAVLYLLTFAIACAGLDRLSRSAWPEAGPGIGVVAVGLLLLARAGNVGTNHLFEPMLLDRGIGFALGWLALGGAVDRPDRRRLASTLAIGLAALVHPSIGLQLAMLVGSGWLAWSLVGRCRTSVGLGQALGSIGLLVLGLIPCLLLQAGQGATLFRGLPPDEFRLLSVDVQGPQHMLPHLWRMPQWLSWACFPALAAISLSGRLRSPARVRLAVLLGVNLVGLGLAWVAVEGLGDLRATVFQPFRMATVARGLALVALADRVLSLARRGDRLGRSRAMLLAVGLTGDWTLVVVTLGEFAFSVADAIASRVGPPAGPLPIVAGLAVLGPGCLFLARHDTESGHVRILAALGIQAALMLVRRHLARSSTGPGGVALVNRPPVLSLARLLGLTRSRPLGRCVEEREPALALGKSTGGRATSATHKIVVQRWSHRGIAWALAAAWAIPTASIVATLLPIEGRGPARRAVEALAERCRFGEIPVGDVERLAAWCRRNTPASACFVGPPGPKTFRLWSRRSLAFNRAASPYHAEGLADWAARFRDHVGFRGSTAAFSRAYLEDRQALERRFGDLDAEGLADLARRQEASHVVAGAGLELGTDAPLERLHAEGRYAVYRLRPQPRSVAVAR